MASLDYTEAPIASPSAVRDLHVIAVHGVGAPEPGDLLAGLIEAASAELKQRPFFRFERTIDGRRYVGAVAEDGANDSKRSIFIWDANWSDVHGAPTGKIPLVIFLLKILTTMVQLCEFGWPKKLAKKDSYEGCSAPLLFGRMYRWLFFGIMLWVMAIPSVHLFASIIADRRLASLAVLVVPTGTWLLAWTFRTVPVRDAGGEGQMPGGDALAAKAGKLWAGGAAALGLLWVWSDLIPDLGWNWRNLVAYVDPEKLLLFSRVSITLALPALIVLAAVELVIKQRFQERRWWDKYAARMAMFILSASILSGLMAVVWALNLTIANSIDKWGLAKEDSLKKWGTTYIETTPYHVGYMEAVVGCGTALFLILILVGLARWCIFTRPYDKSTRAGDKLHATGKGLQNWIAGSLIFLLVLFVITFTMLVDDLHARYSLRNPLGCEIECLCRLTEVGSKEIFDIYLWSALRLLPLVGFLVGPGRIVLDTVADVLLYIPGEERPGHANGTVLRKRLKSLIEALSKPDNGLTPNIVIVAHSQGSRFAVDAIAEIANKATLRLATTGSPIDSLYGRFLDRSDREATSAGLEDRWMNYYRGSDFIGGPIDPPSPPHSEVIDRAYHDHHVNYWPDQTVIKFALGG